MTIVQRNAATILTKQHIHYIRADALSISSPSLVNNYLYSILDDREHQTL